MKKIKRSENEQSTGHFHSFFFVPPTLNLKKNPINQLIKNLAFTLTCTSSAQHVHLCVKFSPDSTVAVISKID